jgi:hypothetical protein
MSSELTKQLERADTESATVVAMENPHGKRESSPAGLIGPEDRLRFCNGKGSRTFTALSLSSGIALSRKIDELEARLSQPRVAKNFMVQADDRCPPAYGNHNASALKKLEIHAKFSVLSELLDQLDRENVPRTHEYYVKYRGPILEIQRRLNRELAAFG